ncbi:MAG: molecular chaperone HtpG [Chloroflexi bacterium]|nr:molecular chaperone HtpG [Chloroflexota bacterium]
MTDVPAEQTTFNFQAEIQQLLHILVHALYTERDIFLRELISNASDALNRAQFESLTNRDMRDQDAELAIRITVDDDARTVTISDTGIGMTRDDLINNLGVIARSGARAFIDALKDAKDAETAKSVIGQFGVGFYSVFMVADKVRVVTQSHKADEPAWAWEAEGGTNFTIAPAERAQRGTDVIVTLKDDADDFLQTWKLKDVIRTYSDTISFPVYVGEDAEPTNQRIAIWRQDPKEIEASKYDEFYRSMTFDFNGSQKVIHMRADVPLQFYALLFVPSSNQPPMFSPRKQVGLKLYARKVLIQDYCTDLLPDYLSLPARRGRQRGHPAQRQPRDRARQRADGPAQEGDHAARAGRLQEDGDIRPRGMDQAVRAVRALPQARRRAVAGGQGRSAAAAAVPDHPRRQQTADHAQGIRRPDGRQPERDLLHRGRRLPQRAAQPAPRTVQQARDRSADPERSG